MGKHAVAMTSILFMAYVLYGCGGGGGGSGHAANIPAGNSGGSSSSSNPSGSGSSGASSTSQLHVLTADYLGGYSGTHTVSASQAAPVLNWAEISSYDANTVSAAGIKTLDYIDPFRQATTDPLYTSDESTFSHDCSGNRIAIPYSATTTFYLMNPASSDLVTLMNAWESVQLGIGHIDAFFFDDIDTLYGVPTMPCGVTQSSWDSADASFIQSNNYPVVFNGYAMNSDAAQVINVSTVQGGAVEGCYTTTSQPTPPYTTGRFWVIDENLELAAGAAGKLFFCYNNGSQDGASSIALRQYIYASFLLTYSAPSSVLWDTFTTPSGLHVFPETQLVPANPLVSAPATVSGLLSSTGVYVREYGVCYVNGASVGRCAAVVNSDPTNAHTMPTLSGQYGHTMSLSGYGVLDAGTISTNGPAAPSTLSPETGLVLLP